MLYVSIGIVAALLFFRVIWLMWETHDEPRRILDAERERIRRANRERNRQK